MHEEDQQHKARVHDGKQAEIIHEREDLGLGLRLPVQHGHRLLARRHGVGSVRLEMLRPQSQALDGLRVSDVHIGDEGRLMQTLISILAGVALLVWGTHIVRSGVLRVFGGGLRKVRWSSTGRGKRGGIRVIYYLDKPRETIYMLFAYPKSRQDDLTPAQLKVLRQLVREEFK